MRLTLEQLETFYWVARLGGFRAAAAHQHLSQPTVSARIHELERILGSVLFERDRKRVALTLAGRDILLYAEKMLRLSAEIVSASTSKDALRGILRLGVNESTAMTCLTALLTYLKRAHPGLKVELTVDVGTALSVRLNKRTLDVAILTQPVTDAHVTDVRLGAAQLEWLAARSLNPPSEPCSAAALTGLPIFTIAGPSTLFDAAQAWFSSQGAVFEDYSTCNSMAAMAQLVKSGHAVALLPPVVLAAEMASGDVVIVRTVGCFPESDFYVSYLRECEGAQLQGFIAHAAQTMQRSSLLRSVP